MILTLCIIMYIIYDTHIVHNYLFRKVNTLFRKLEISERRILNLESEFLRDWQPFNLDTCIPDGKSDYFQNTTNMMLFEPRMWRSEWRNCAETI
jgi:hypothetical protein